MFHKVKSVEPLDNFILLITFENGVKKNYDLKPLFSKYEVFNLLANSPNIFKNVKVDIGGYGISWNSDIDLSCNELWDNGISL